MALAMVIALSKNKSAVGTAPPPKQKGIRTLPTALIHLSTEEAPLVD